MELRKFTIETRLSLEKEQLNYFTTNLTKQAHIFRQVWKWIQTSGLSQSKLNTYLQQTFKIDKRTANSHIQTAKGRLRALSELKKLELDQLNTKINALNLERIELTKKLDHHKEKVMLNKVFENELNDYRKLKHNLWQKKQKLNRLNQKLVQAKQMMDAKFYPICWGSNSLFKKQYALEKTNYRSHQGWLNDFRRKRDSQINYVGSSDESCGNQCFQLTYDEQTQCFRAKIRKDIALMNGKGDKYIYLEGINFKLYQEKLVTYLQEPKHTITTRILRRKKKWYLQVIFNYLPEATHPFIDETKGTLGLDFNVGFIEMSETDPFGNLVSQHYYPLTFHGMGNKAKSEMRSVVASIVKIARTKEKAIVIEDLDFKKKKNSTRKNSIDKKYNKMIHAFDYSRYKESFENACYRQQVKLIKVNPMFTSQIGNEKFSVRMKLTVHQAASYVIARKGQGYLDRLRKKPKTRKRSKKKK